MTSLDAPLGDSFAQIHLSSVNNRPQLLMLKIKDILYWMEFEASLPLSSNRMVTHLGINSKSPRHFPCRCVIEWFPSPRSDLIWKHKVDTVVSHVWARKFSSSFFGLASASSHTILIHPLTPVSTSCLLDAKVSNVNDFFNSTENFSYEFV